MDGSVQWTVESHPRQDTGGNARLCPADFPTASACSAAFVGMDCGEERLPRTPHLKHSLRGLTPIKGYS